MTSFPDIGASPDVAEHFVVPLSFSENAFGVSVPTTPLAVQVPLSAACVEVFFNSAVDRASLAATFDSAGLHLPRMR